MVLMVLSLRFGRRWLWVLVLYSAWVGGPIMGFIWTWRGPSASAVPVVRLRCMTWNIKYGQHDVAPLIADILRYNPDVLFFQDAGGATRGSLNSFLKQWNVRSHGQYVIASRWPLGKPGVRLISDPEDREDLLRTEMQIGTTRVVLYTVHLLTPRDGLNALRAARRQPDRYSEAVQELQQNVEHRTLQAGRVAQLIRQESGAIILAGDLNSPDESLACKALRSANLHDAFAEGGRGFGYTYGHFLLRNRVPWLPQASWMRIDHILLSPQIQATHCWTGTGQASDHRPVYADLIISTP